MGDEGLVGSNERGLQHVDFQAMMGHLVVVE